MVMVLSSIQILFELHRFVILIVILLIQHEKNKKQRKKTQKLSKFNLTKQVFCNGIYVCTGTRITSVYNVSFSGIGSMARTTVTSMLNDTLIGSHDVDRTMIVNVYSEYVSNEDQIANIYCTSGDTCIINCVSKLACQYIQFYCTGDCDIRYTDDANNKVGYISWFFITVLSVIILC